MDLILSSVSTTGSRQVYLPDAVRGGSLRSQASFARTNPKVRDGVTFGSASISKAQQAKFPGLAKILPRLVVGTTCSAEDLHRALSTVVASHDQVHRFEDCGYVSSSPSLKAHELASVADSKKYFLQAGLKDDTLPCDFVQLGLLIHDFGEHLGELTSHSSRVQKRQCEGESMLELRSTVESMIARLTIALALNVAQKKGSTDLYAKWTEAGRQAISQAKATEEGEPIIAAAQFLKEFQASHRDSIKQVMKSDIGLVTARLMAVFDKIESWKTTDTVLAILVKAVEKLNTLAYVAEKADFKEILGPSLDRVLQYPKPVLDRLNTEAKKSRSRAVKDLASVVDSRFRQIQSRLNNKADNSAADYLLNDVPQVLDSNAVDLTVDHPVDQASIVDLVSLQDPLFSGQMFDDQVIGPDGITKTASWFGEDRLFSETLNQTLKPIEMVWKRWSSQVGVADKATVA